MPAQLRDFEIVLLWMPAINIRRLNGHRAVDVNGNRRDLSRILHLADYVNQFLRSAYGKSRNNEALPSRRNVFDDLS